MNCKIDIQQYTTICSLIMINNSDKTIKNFGIAYVSFSSFLGLYEIITREKK